MQKTEKEKTFHEARDSNMDRQLPPRSPWQKYKYPIIGGVLLLAALSYMLVYLSGGRKLYIDAEKLVIAEVEASFFIDYIDNEAVTQAIHTIQVNTLESGIVQEIVAEDGAFLQKGDPILILQNPSLEQSISDMEAGWEKQRIQHEERKLEMEKNAILLKQQSLQAAYELRRLEKDYALGEEEFQMGVKSKAQLELQKEEYEYRKQNTTLQLENLQHDSAASHLRRRLMNSDLQLERNRLATARNRREHLIVRAPISGQLSYLNVTPGQQVGASTAIGEIKVLDNFKLFTRLNEFYIDRVQPGLPATISYLKENFPLRVSKVVPEVRDKQFDVELVFTDKLPDNLRIGKNFRVRIEMAQPDSALIIPRGDFFQTTGGQWIYKLNKAGDRAVKVPITIERQNPAHYEVGSGLQAGDRVITSGYANFGNEDELIIK